jgi:hypothetical protein
MMAFQKEFAKALNLWERWRGTGLFEVIEWCHCTHFGKKPYIFME